VRESRQLPRHHAIDFNEENEEVCKSRRPFLVGTIAARSEELLFFPKREGKCGRNSEEEGSLN